MPRSDSIPLNPTLLNRLTERLRPDFARTVLARRIAAGGLVLLAAVAALRPDPAGSYQAVAVAVHDLGPGTALTADDVRLEKRSAAGLPEGAQTNLGEVLGATLAGPARRGEVITDVRILGSRLAGLSAGPDARLVALHLADPAMTDLIRAGDVVDVLGAGVEPGTTTATEAHPRVIATNAVVVLVSAAAPTLGSDHTRVILVALPAVAAKSVAGANLAQPVTVTIH